jgi:hypothetical protein
MNTQYRHSQPGYLSIVISFILITVGVIMYICGLPPGMLLGVIALVVLVFTYKLTVEIKDGFLKFWFGPGLFWKTISLEQIAYCEPFKGVFSGWGIRYICNGWLYNVSGMKAVTIVLKSGKRMHIGTDEPVQLIEAINSVLHGQAGMESARMWCEVKVDYLKRLEQALSVARHPRSFEILADVSSHLDRRFAELEPQNRNWENFQKIATEMGPPSEYTELVGQEQGRNMATPSARYVITLFLILVAVTAGMIALPKILKRNVILPPKQVGSQTQHEQTVASAIEAAKSWLQLADEGAYSQSWSQAAEYFRKNVSEEQWGKAIEPVRKPLGKTLSRKVINSTYTTTLPGAPDGQYVVIQFETSFENKRNAVETVTPMMEPNGQWRVSGYYIR